jgi:hypothetical protein
VNIFDRLNDGKAAGTFWIFCHCLIILCASKWFVESIDRSGVRVINRYLATDTSVVITGYCPGCLKCAVGDFSL